MKKLTYILTAGLILVAGNCFAQENWGEGEVEDAVVVVEKERKITLPFASRRFEKVAPLPATEQTYDLNYTLQPVPFTGDPLVPRMRVLTIREENLSKINGNFVKAGFGNYVTPLFMASLSNRRNAEYSYGVKANHISSGKGPVDGKNSANSYTYLKGFANGFTTSFRYGGDVNYQRDGYYFYGYTPGTEVDRDSIKQTLNHLQLNAHVGSVDAEADFQYLLGLSFNNIADNYSAKESDFTANFGSTLILDDPLTFGLDAGVSLTTRNDASFDSQKRNIFRGKGYLVYELSDQITIMGGARVAYERDTAGTFHIYPVARASYEITDNLLLYAGIDGDLEQRGYRQFIRENQFLGPDVALLHQDKKFEFNAGLKGAGFEVGFATARFNDMGFHVNSLSDTTRFEIEYDKATRLNIFGEITLTASAKHNIMLRADYWGYSTDTLTKAWHKPNYRVGLNGSTNFFGKIYLDVDAYFIGGITARMPGDFSASTLDPIIDLNAKIEYKVSDQFGAFISGNNLIGQKYQRYLNYQSRGIQFMGGFTYTF